MEVIFLTLSSDLILHQNMSKTLVILATTSATTTLEEDIKVQK